MFAPSESPCEVLQADGTEMCQLALVFIEPVAEEVVLPIHREPRTDVSGAHTVEVRYLEPVVRGPGKEGDAIAVIENLLEIAKAMGLLGVIVKRGGRAVWGLDTENRSARNRP